MSFQFRQYQFDNKASIRAAHAAGVKNVCYVCPTGGGKSEVVSDLVQEYQYPEVVIAHRQELVGQMSMHLASKEIYHRIIAPKPIIAAAIAQQREELGKSFYTPTGRAAVAGVDTLKARASDLRDWAAQIRRWTIDECHHVLVANKWGEACAMFPHAVGLGVTATPKRADGRGLGRHADGVFDQLILGPTMRELINAKYLSEYQIVVPSSDFDLSALTIGSDGDYSKGKMREESKRSKIVGNVVKEYCKWAFGKQGICFATDVETSREMAEEFQRFGIPAASIDGTTDPTERVNLIKAFKRREIWVLVNVDLFGEGFDVPAVEVVMMARPTKSLAVYMQQFGRALRILAGKLWAIIIDHVSNIVEHQLPDKMRYWSLDGRDRKTKDKDPDDIPITVCTGPGCYKPYLRIFRACPHCGFVPEAMGGRRSPEAVDGDLLLLDADVLAKMRAATVLEAPGDMANRVGHAAGQYAAKHALDKQRERIEAQQKLRDAIAQWAGIGGSLGRDHPELYRRFFHWIGVDALTALTLPRDDMERIRERVIHG
jgi:DNA repair protein RadD